MRAALFLMLAATAAADDFAAANAAFAEGKFPEARSGYERAVEQGGDANAYFNLGNTHHRLEDAGRAALAYERALAAAPWHAEARANLKFVREKSAARVAPLRAYERVLERVPYIVGAAFGLALAWLGWLWAGVALWRRGGLGVICGALLVALGAGVASAALWWRQREERAAVLLAAADARRDPAERSPLAEALPPGSRVRVLSTQGAWAYAELPGGTRGWLDVKSFEFIHPQISR